MARIRPSGQFFGGMKLEGMDDGNCTLQLITDRTAMNVTLRLLGALLASSVLLGSASAAAQAAFVETFDNVGPVDSGQQGPRHLIADGWIFRNQSEPLGSGVWSQGAFFQPQAGAGYLGVDSLSTDFFGGRISTWAILPLVPNQVAGDTLTVHLRAVDSSNVDRLEIRYSPSGSRETGLDATEVGDFTTLLQAVDPMPIGGWVATSVQVPGSGALALRYFVDNACNHGCFASEIGIDTLSVGDEPPPPCNLPPIPAAGETETWTAAGGPWVVCSDLSIPAGALVVVEPGATIDVRDGFTLDVEGTLLATGTNALPIWIEGGISTLHPPVRVRGLMELSHGQVRGRLHLAHGGSLVVRESTFPQGMISSASSVGGGAQGTYVEIENSEFFAGAFDSLAITDGTLVVRDTTIHGSGLSLLRGYLLAESVVLEGGGLSLVRERYTQPAFVDGFTIRNAPGPAISLFGWNAFLGATNQLSGNLVPVSITGGLLAGSTVPTSGNVNDWVDVGGGGVRGNATWARLDVPYVVDGADQSGGKLTLEPGARIQLTPGSQMMIFSTGAFRALGRPEAPIVFERHLPSAPWDRIWLVDMSTGPRLEYCVIDGATAGVQADGSFVQVDTCEFQSNTDGALATSFGLLRARGSRFLDNGVGVRTTQQGGAGLSGLSNPNSFVGNDVGVSAVGNSVDATGNWWGHASGPGPEGAGDPIAGPVLGTPFLTKPPDATDTPPIVRMLPTSPLLESGSRVILNWQAEDDLGIVSQRVLFSEHANFDSSFVVLADDLGSHARSVEVTVPVSHPSSIIDPSFFRVVATDARGQVGLDEISATVPYVEDLGTATLDFLTDLSVPFVFGDDIHVQWNYTGGSATWVASIVIDGELESVGYGGGHTGISSWDFRMPYVSTDTARIRLTFRYGAGGRTRDFFSDRFSIRPDARLGDAHPVVTMTSPSPGTVFHGGQVVPITWTAVDDEELRSFRLQASTDSGRTWSMISPELPGTSRSYSWRLPQSTGHRDLRLRVVAADLRFQSSSDETHVEVLPSAGLGGKARAQTRR